MAQPHSQYISQQPGMANVSLQQMLGQKASAIPPGMQMNQAKMSVGSPSVGSPSVGSPSVVQERTIIDDFEAAFQGCIAPMQPGVDNANKLTITPDKLRSSMELSIQEFMEQARKVEAYFLKKHATVSQQQPELVLQEEVEELSEEIARKELTIRAHSAKVKQWLENIRTLQNTFNDKPSTAPILANQGQAGQMQSDTMQQQMNQRR